MVNTFRPLSDMDSGLEEALLTAPWGSYSPGPVQAGLIGLTRRSFLQRGKLREKMTNLICGMGRPLDIRFRGLKFRVEGLNNLIENGLLTRPSYNSVEINFLCEALGPGDAALDIGCNIGLYALPMAKATGPSGRVFAIDANAQMTRRLAFHANANGFDHITPVNCAVGERDAKVDLMIRRDDVAIVAVKETEHGSVTMRPLSSIVAEAGIDRVKALKIDIEGHEDKALVPYFETMPEPYWPERIVIEYLPPNDYPGCASAFAARGYRLVGRTRNNSMYQRG